MRMSSSWFTSFAIVAAVFPLVKPYIGLGDPSQLDWLSSMILFGTLIICGMLVEGFNAVLNKLDGK